MPILRYYNVFNIDDTDLKPREGKTQNQPIEKIEKNLSKYWDLNKICLGNPAYSSTLDKVYMPNITNFETTKGYYSALTHEIIHSTGHENRLKRKGIIEKTMFGSSIYAYEELVAELGSAFLCAKLGLEKDISNTIAYIQSWIKALKKDKTFIFKASKEAQKAEEFILDFERNVKRKTEIDINQKTETAIGM